MRVAIVPGSFDPITSGHLDIIRRAAIVFDKVVVGVSKKIPKNTLFSADEREAMVEKALTGMNNVDVEIFDSLLVEFARRHDAHAVVRGLRAVSDFEHEFQMAQLNRELDSKIETMFVMASPKYAYLSSSAVKEIAEYSGSVKGLVPDVVETALAAKFPSMKGGR